MRRRTSKFIIAQKIRFIEAVGIEKEPRVIRVDGVLTKKSEFDFGKKRLRINLENENAEEISFQPSVF